MDERFLRQAELHLRLHLHALVPLHESLVNALSRSPAPPLELATALEDVGQAYLRMAETLNGEIIGRGLLDGEPEEADDFAEARIDRFASELLSGAGVVTFADGMRLDGRAALEASSVVGHAIKSAVVLARGKRARMGPRSIG